MKIKKRISTTIQYQKLAKEIAVGLSVTLVYIITAILGLQLAQNNSNATAIWAPTGIAIAALLIFGIRLWPFVMIGAFIANLTISSIPVSFGISIGNALEAVVGAYLIQRFAFGRKAFDSPAGVMRFTLVVIFVCMISATIGTFVSAYGQPQSTMQNIWLTWWLGDLAGAILITPLLLLWSNAIRWEMEWKKTLEFVFVLAVLALSIFFIYSDLFTITRIPLQFLQTPLIIWIAYRFTPREMALTLVISQVIAITGTINGFGPFVKEAVADQLLLLQSRATVASIALMFFSAIVLQRNRAEEALHNTINEKELLLRELRNRVRKNLRSLPVSRRIR